MPTFYDSQNNEFALGARIGSGGEGAVYACADANLVAKIYHAPVTDEKAEKLRWMAANKNEKLLKTAAWVVDILLDKPDGKVVGFTMPNVKAKEIHELYSLKSRRVYFPEATWHFLVNTAANVARAFYSLHRSSHIMGDVNHGNCVVLADGTVKLIDCDSYSINRGDFRYACEVGVATHLAPELQGKDLSKIERETKHDNFGLAVIIFQLLFLGRHPFAGNFLGDEDKSIEECIRELRFAYGDGAESRRVKQPPGTLPLAAAAPRVAAMFERAFLTEDRPEPREWIEALEDLSINLETCALHPGHLYFNELNHCPWCDIEARTGLMLFPFVASGKNLDGEKPFNVFTIENLIASFGINETALANPTLPNILPPPSPEIAEARQQIRRTMYISVGSQFVGLIVLMMIFGVGVAFFVGVCAMICWMFYINNSAGNWGDDPQYSLGIAKRNWEIFQNDWQTKTNQLNLDQDVAGIRNKVAYYQKFQQTSLRELKDFEGYTERKELFQHLRSKPLEDANIENLGEEEKQWLVGKGIKTAAEVSENRVRMFNDFNGEIVPKLLEWRSNLEREFKAAPRPFAFKDEYDEFVKKTARERRRLETEIENSLTILRGTSVNLRRREKEFLDNSGKVANRYLQAKSDAEAAGTTAPTIIALVLITILLPYFGFVVSQMNHTSRNFPADKNGSGSGTIAAPAKNQSSVSTDNLAVPDANITNAEIENMQESLRNFYVDNLLTQALALTYNKADYEKAEEKLWLALRLQGNETRILNQLGYVLTAQEKYDESLQVLYQASAIDKSNSYTQVYTGINYLKLKRFNDARQILTKTINEYPVFYDAHYNLGLAYAGLNDYVAAAESMRRAIEINPDNINPHYQLGYAYYKLGNKEQAKDEYLILLGKDATLAQKLRNETQLDFPN